MTTPAMQPTSSASSADEPRLEQVVAFLLGEGEIDGKYFGYQAPSLPSFWWRKHLRSAMQSAIVPQVVQAPIDFDAWQQNPYTIALQRSIHEDYEPRKKAEHFDDHAVDCFAKLMKAKMAKKRGEGRSGWDDSEQCTVEYLSALLHEHVIKGDPVDVANICMMIRHYDAPIAAPIVATVPSEPIYQICYEPDDGTKLAWVDCSLSTFEHHKSYPNLAFKVRTLYAAPSPTEQASKEPSNCSDERPCLPCYLDQGKCEVEQASDVRNAAKKVQARIDSLCEAANTPDADYFDASTNMMLATRDLLIALGCPHKMDISSAQAKGNAPAEAINVPSSLPWEVVQVGDHAFDVVGHDNMGSITICGASEINSAFIVAACNKLAKDQA